MRTLLAVTFALLPLVQAQNARLLKSVEPKYDVYSPDLATDFDAANASVTLTVGSDGKPLALDKSSVLLPMAVVMALKDYEFQPQGVVPHGRSVAQGDTYQVTLTVPIRQSKEGRYPPLVGTSVIDTAGRVRLGPGIVNGLRVKMVAPEYPVAARHAHITGRIDFETVITKEGNVARLMTNSGPFPLIEAAYDAVRQWQYKPYLLRAEPTEVVTEVAVNFNLN